MPQSVADVVELSHRSTVSQASPPRVHLGEDCVKLWLRPEIERWALMSPFKVTLAAGAPKIADSRTASRGMDCDHATRGPGAECRIARQPGSGGGLARSPTASTLSGRPTSGER